MDDVTLPQSWLTLEAREVPHFGIEVILELQALELEEASLLQEMNLGENQQSNMQDLKLFTDVTYADDKFFWIKRGGW